MRTPKAEKTKESFNWEDIFPFDLLRICPALFSYCPSVSWQPSHFFFFSIKSHLFLFKLNLIKFNLNGDWDGLTGQELAWQLTVNCTIDPLSCLLMFIHSPHTQTKKEMSQRTMFLLKKNQERKPQWHYLSENVTT